MILVKFMKFLAFNDTQGVLKTHMYELMTGLMYMN